MPIKVARPRPLCQEDLRQVVERLPDLTAEGLADDASPEFAQEQEKLLQSVATCARICRWLGRKAKVTRRPSSSYNLTFQANRQIGYLTHGQFIAAAVHCGFRYRRTGTSGLLLNMSLEPNIGPPQVEFFTTSQKSRRRP